MIKRPIVWFGLAYVFGEILETIIGRAALLVFAVFFAAALLINVCVGRIQKRGCKKAAAFRTRLCFCVLPLFMFFGGAKLSEAKQSADDAWMADMTYTEGTAGGELAATTFVCTVEKTEEKIKSKYIYVRQLKNLEEKGEIRTEKTMEERRAYMPQRLLLISDKNSQVRYGDKLLVTGCMERFEKASNPGAYDAWEANAMSGLYYKMFPERVEILSRGGSLAAHGLLNFKERLMTVYRTLLDEKSAGVLCGIMLGDKQGIAPDLKMLYQSQGIGHLFAVSGLHMSMAGVGVYRLLRRLTVPLKGAFLLSFVLMLAYSFMCGMPLSCIRAVIMAALSMGAEVFGRSYDSLSALALAALCILWQQPLALTSFGLIMSFAAVWTLIGFVPFLLKSKVTGTTGEHAVKKLLPGLCITLITTPVIGWYIFEVPLYSTVLNFLLLPLMSLLFPMAAAGGILGMIFVPAGRFFIGGVYYILQLYEKLCGFFEKFPCSVLVTGRPSWPLMLLLAVVFPVLYILAVRYKRKYVLITGLALLAAEYFLLALPKIPSNSRIIFADVGQGDCALLSMNDGTNWLIDGGSSSEKNIGKYTIEKLLKYYGIGRLDGVFLSHMDGDHTNGVTELIEMGYKIDRLFVPAVCPSEDKLAAMKMAAARQNIRTEVFDAGDRLGGKEEAESFGSHNWRIDCLHPTADFVTDDDNEASMILLLNIEGFRVLFTGDGASEAEAAASPLSLNIDLLKVGHHGSKYSSGEDFLEKLNPKAAVISCGKNNRYGHPHKEVLQRLDNLGCRRLATPQSGAITAEIEDGRFVIYSYKIEENS